MEITEHYGNFPPDWNKDEITELMRLVKDEIEKHQGDKETQMFYAKIYGRLMGERMDAREP